MKTAGAEAANGDGGVGCGGGDADGDAGPVLEAGVDDGDGFGVEGERPRDVDRGAVERGRVQGGSVQGCEACARPLDPDVAGAVDHEFGHVHVVEDVFEPGQEGLEVGKGDAHSLPASRARQYG